VKRIGRSGVGFGGVDARVLYIPSCPGTTGLTGALDQSDRCETFVGFVSGDVLDSCVFGSCWCWSDFGRFGGVLLGEDHVWFKDGGWSLPCVMSD
jgi:hypothetical protein